MIATLRLRYAETAVREPAAWFVAGATAEDWLAETADWDLSAARLLIVPTSFRDRTPAGVLVFGAGPRGGMASPTARPYGVVAGRLYLPVEARIEPAVDERELRELLSDDEVYVWHPATGLVAAPRAATPNAAALLSAGLDESEPWNAAVPGVALNGRLTSIEPTFVPTVDDALSAGRGDIGTQPVDLDHLPPSPGETPPRAAGGGMGRAVESALLKAAQWLARQMPHGGGASGKADGGAGGAAGGGGWLGSLENWIAGRLANLAKSLDSARNRELDRLMNLLKNDPDEGLRFALPMGGGEHRGVAPPSDQLGPRNIDFNLNRLAGGGPADVWDVAPDFQRELIARYRELAAREIALGRHRRAAYIFAQLLGDYRSAANTLADGGHWREAATLYDQRLNQPAEAARCLRQGGLWAEAIALYERLGEFETVGDIHAQLEQTAEAEAAWRMAVAARLNASDSVAAAALLENKIKSPDEALSILLDAWPRSLQANAALVGAFALLARHHRHEEAVGLVGRLADPDRASDSDVPLAEILSHQARSYPDEKLRASAADHTRIVAARRLTGSANDDEASRLVVAVARLEPDDKLLPRDGRRYMDGRRRRRTEPRRPGPRNDRLTVHREIRLPQLDWRTAAAGYEAIYLAGYRDRELVVMRTDWNGVDVQEPIGMKWNVEPGHSDNPILLAADPLGSSPPVVHVAGSAPQANSRWFRVSGPFPEPAAVGPHRGVGPFTHAFCYSARDTFHTVEVGDDVRLVVNGYFGDHSQLAGLVSIDFTELLDEDEPPPVSPLPLAVVEETVILGIGRKLCFARPNRRQEVVELPHPVTRLSASPAHSRVRVLASMTRGAVMFWGSTPDAFQSPLASEMSDPCVALSRDGYVIAAAKDEIDVYTAARGRLQLKLRAAGPGWQPLSALAPRHVNRFALVAPDGRVIVYDLPTG